MSTFDPGVDEPYTLFQRLAPVLLLLSYLVVALLLAGFSCAVIYALIVELA